MNIADDLKDTATSTKERSSLYLCEGLYVWTRKEIADVKFIGALSAMFDKNVAIDLYLLKDSCDNMRLASNGLVTFVGEVLGKKIGVIFSDFKIYGGGFGEENSNRFVSFIEEMERYSIPVVLFLDTIGVKITEGRKVFDSAFRIIPALKKFTEKNLLITVNKKRVLGLGAILYALGDYRLAIQEKSFLNLTGPEVFKMFFGEKVNFEEVASSVRQQGQTQLVHEIVNDLDEACLRIRHIVQYQQVGDELIQTSVSCSTEDDPILSTICSQKCMLFHQLSSVVKVTLHKFSNLRFATISNPVGKGNMLTVEAIKKFRMALSLLKKLNMPIFTLVDTPGADPRAQESDLGMIDELTQLTLELINYPYYKRGIVVGRCFGGASVCALPPFFGGEMGLVVKGAQCGIMGNQILSHLLSESPRLHDEWTLNKQGETEDFADYKALGLFEKVIERVDIGKEIISSLLKFYKSNN